MDKQMDIVLICGTNHKGSTYNIAHNLAEKIGGNITEFFLPKDFDEFCNGCLPCFNLGEDKCPHYSKIKPITEALISSDVIILASPVYVFHQTGAMKALLDHYGYMWMAHRPEESMFKKQGVCISTAAGAGLKSTNKDLADSLFYWGVPKIYKYGVPIAATSWDQVKEDKKKDIDKNIESIAKKIKKKNGKVKPGFKTKGFFSIMRMLEKNGWNPKDVEYWKEKGWLGNKRPWKE